MKVITFKDISKQNISPKLCYEWASEMILNKSNSLLPPKISMKPADGIFCNVMPSIVGETGGVKVVTRYPERIPALESLLTIYNVESGENLAFMDATWITAMRTGAVAAHSILLLAKKNFSVIGMVGLGNTARAALLVLAEMCPEKELTIKLKKFNDEEISFAKRFESYSNLHFSFVETPQEVVKGSDVIISAATYMPEDFCEDDCYDPGVLVVPIHTLGFTNCDFFFDKVFADDYGHVCHFRNFDKFKKFAEVTDIVNNRVAGRENDEERILAYNIGISLHDINFARHIYELLKDDSSLTDIELDGPTEKFWI